MTRILLIDDEPDLLELYQLALESAHHTVATATEGRTAVDRAKRFQPDVIGLDWLLPDKSGDDILRELKATPETRSIPVLVISALEGLAPIARALGAIGVLVKPFRPKTLLAAIADARPSRQIADARRS